MRKVYARSTVTVRISVYDLKCNLNKIQTSSDRHSKYESVTGYDSMDILSPYIKKA